jgi:hypothetical protein
MIYLHNRASEVPEKQDSFIPNLQAWPHGHIDINYKWNRAVTK